MQAYHVFSSSQAPSFHEAQATEFIHRPPGDKPVRYQAAKDADSVDLTKRWDNVCIRIGEVAALRFLVAVCRAQISI